MSAKKRLSFVERFFNSVDFYHNRSRCSGGLFFS